MKAFREPLAKARAWAARAATPPPPDVVETTFDRIGTFWAGPALPQTHALCLRSWLALGYQVDVFSYAPVAGIPDGCTLRDAAEILPRETFPDPATRPPLIADIFRLALLARGEHLWCDTDLVLFRRVPAAQHILAAREYFGPVCNAILWIRPGLGLVEDILAAFHAQGISPWSHGRVYAARLRQRLTGRPWPPNGYPMHHWGRHALEYGVVKYRLEEALHPHTAFYHREAYGDTLVRADTPFGHIVDDPAVFGLHLFWKEERQIAAAEPGSFFDWLKRRFGEEP